MSEIVPTSRKTSRSPDRRSVTREAPDSRAENVYAPDGSWPRPPPGRGSLRSTRADGDGSDDGIGVCKHSAGTLLDQRLLGPESVLASTVLHVLVELEREPPQIHEGDERIGAEPGGYTAGMASIFRTRARRRSAASSVSALIRSAVNSIRPATRSTRSLTRARSTAALTLTLPDCSMTFVCRPAVFGAHADPITAPTTTAPIHCRRMLKAQGVRTTCSPSCDQCCTTQGLLAHLRDGDRWPVGLPMKLVCSKRPKREPMVSGAIFQGGIDRRPAQHAHQPHRPEVGQVRESQRKCPPACAHPCVVVEWH